MITVAVVVMCIGFFVNRQTTRGKTLGRFDQRNVPKKKKIIIIIIRKKKASIIDYLTCSGRISNRAVI